MYLGHFAVGLAAKPVVPKVSLGILLVATQVIDILYAIFVLVGVGHPGGASPWDHGLVMSLIWSATAFVISFLFYRDIRSGILIGLLVLSHWVCDFISWDHVLPLAFSDSPRVGLGLYNSVPVMLAGDFGLFGGALTLYLFRTKANDRTGKWAPWFLVAYLIALIPTSLLPGKLVIIMALGMTLVVPFGMWIDRHRSVIPVRGKKHGMPMV
ncbi:MAG: hypothetical protein MUP44_06230 [Anaerolineales bacterium]|nr:hypothetical protein [Anaerolineales bacterium]